MIRASAMQAVGEIGRLAKTIERLSEVPRRTAILAAPGLTALLQAEFRTGTDPYGRPWAPLRPSTIARGRRPPPLSDSRRLRDGTKAVVARSNYAGLRLVVGAAYGYFHQVGFHAGRTRVPPRRILPQFGMPASWRKVLDDAARAAVRQVRS